MDKFVEVFDLDTCLLHRVTLAQSDGVVLKSLMVDSDAERSAYGILTAVTLAD